MKLEKLEEFVGNDLAISYVGIRGDENRDGFISNNPNIQAIFPFRKIFGVLTLSTNFYIRKIWTK